MFPRLLLQDLDGPFSEIRKNVEGASLDRIGLIEWILES